MPWLTNANQREAVEMRGDAKTTALLVALSGGGDSGKNDKEFSATLDESSKAETAESFEHRKPRKRRKIKENRYTLQRNKMFTEDPLGYFDRPMLRNFPQHQHWMPWWVRLRARRRYVYKVSINKHSGGMGDETSKSDTERVNVRSDSQENGVFANFQMAKSETAKPTFLRNTSKGTTIVLGEESGSCQVGENSQVNCFWSHPKLGEMTFSDNECCEAPLETLFEEIVPLERKKSESSLGDTASSMSSAFSTLSNTELGLSECDIEEEDADSVVSWTRGHTWIIDDDDTRISTKSLNQSSMLPVKQGQSIDMDACYFRMQENKKITDFPNSFTFKGNTSRIARLAKSIQCFYDAHGEGVRGQIHDFDVPDSAFPFESQTFSLQKVDFISIDSRRHGFVYTLK